ncbi:MAG: dienelactone hydrolase family protein [Spirochaetales bacterium]|nr:dienelactone hydrolase family protein [Spirochaetales bacterium]
MFRMLKRFLVGSILAFLIVGIGCAGGMKESDLVSWEKHFEMIQPLGAGAGGAHVLMTDTSEVRVGSFTYNEEKVVDIYYPPDMDFNEVRPVLVLLGLSDVLMKKDYGVPYRYTGQALGWAQSAAELGFVVLAHDTGQFPKKDLIVLVEWIRKKGKKYGLNGDEIGIWSSSDACDIAVKSLRPDNNGIPSPSAIFAVFYYGNLTAYSGQDPEVPILIVTAENDGSTDMARIEKFISKMSEQGNPITHIHHNTGHHAFEVGQDSTETRNIIDQTLSFMLTHTEL